NGAGRRRLRQGRGPRAAALRRARLRRLPRRRRARRRPVRRKARHPATRFRQRPRLPPRLEPARHRRVDPRGLRPARRDAAIPRPHRRAGRRHRRVDRVAAAAARGWTAMRILYRAGLHALTCGSGLCGSGLHALTGGSGLYALTFALALLSACQRAPAPALSEADRPGFGGDFTLTTQDNQPFHLADVRGRPVVLFFGYTSCPDMCPMTMSRITGAVARAG